MAAVKLTDESFVSLLGVLRTKRYTLYCFSMLKSGFLMRKATLGCH